MGSRHRPQGSDGSASHPHQPAQPSTLRQSHVPSSRPVSYADSDNDDDGVHVYTGSGPVRPGGSTESTPLLISATEPPSVHPGKCDHGTFSPRASTPLGAQELENAIDGMQGSDDWKSWLKQRMRTKKMGQSSELAHRAGVNDDTIM